MLQTLRKSVTWLEYKRLSAGQRSCCTQPDWENNRNSRRRIGQRDSSNMSLPFDPIARGLWGIPITVTNAATANCRAHTRTRCGRTEHRTRKACKSRGAETSNADDWSRNLISRQVRRPICDKRFPAVGCRTVRFDRVTEGPRAGGRVGRGARPPGSWIPLAPAAPDNKFRRRELVRRHVDRRRRRTALRVPPDEEEDAENEAALSA